MLICKIFIINSFTLGSSDSKLKIGLANDGDADRFGIIDENGKFVSTNDVLLLAAYHLIKNRGIEGTILRSHATASQLDEIADLYDMPVSITPVGFKFIGEDILDSKKSHNSDVYGDSYSCILRLFRSQVNDIGGDNGKYPHRRMFYHKEEDGKKKFRIMTLV